MTLYKGRIGAKQSELMDRINRSLPVDIRLLPYDIQTNRAWAGQLFALNILSDTEYDDILKSLEKIEVMTLNGDFDSLPNDEDVHTLTERLLTEMIGDAGAKIHTGRSRNDQVVCDLRLYTVDSLDEMTEAMVGLIELLRNLGKEHADVVMPGTTHLQPAQPITLGYFLLSLAFSLVRDLERLQDAKKRTNLCPLGSGALAGSGFAVDRIALAEALGFDGLCENSLDAIADRDFVQEIASCCATLCGHLSRYAEQFIVWANPAFGFIRFSDEWSTGSSMMPQKRNPDAMELIRGKAARCIGNATTLLALTKGVPLSYAKDLQEDKEALFDAMDTALLCTQVFSKAISSATFFPDKMQRALTGDLLATDLADMLVEIGVPFRQAHERVAEFVTKLEDETRSLLDATHEELATAFPDLNGSIAALSFGASVARRKVRGGTAPESVLKQVEILTELLGSFKTD